MKKQITAWILLAAVLASLLSGCGGKDEDTQPAGSDALSSKYAYQAEFLDFKVDEADQFQGVDNCCISGNYVFFSGTCITGKAPLYDEATGEPVIDGKTGEQAEATTYETALYRMDLESRETVRLDYDPLETPEGMLGSSSITGLSEGLNGTFWIVESMNPYQVIPTGELNVLTGQMGRRYEYGEPYRILSQYDADGQLLKTLDLSELIQSGSPQLLFDQDENIYVNTNGTIYLLDPQGTLLAELSNQAGKRLSQMSETEIGVFEEGSAGTLHLIDAASKDYGQEVRLGRRITYFYPGIEGYQYLYENGTDTVYGYVEETGEPEKLFSWLDCDVSREKLGSIKFRENGDIAAIIEDYSGSSIRYGLLLMKRVDPSTLPQKQELTLACMFLDSSIRSAVASFNQSHSSARIVIKDYSQFNTNDDRSAGLTRLNTEILAGNVPDILYTSGLPVDQYAAVGILTDLWPLIDGDEGLSREDLMTHLFDVLTTDGKLFQIPSYFYISTAVGSADVIGDRTGWTLEEMLDAMEAMPDSSEAFGDSSTKNSVLSLCLWRDSERFIDWETQTCRFDSQEFLEILNFANSFPAEYSGDASETTFDRFQAGRQLLMVTSVSGFDHMQVISALVGGNPCYVGMPSSAGSGNGFAANGLAITSACQDTELAWSFLRTFLTEEFQRTLSFGFPTNRHAFEALVAQAKVSSGEAYWTEEGITVEIGAMSQEDYDTFMRLYESCSSVNTSNGLIDDIAAAEAAPFFDGQKTAEEAAALIQNRVGLYVMEQK